VTGIGNSKKTAHGNQLVHDDEDAAVVLAILAALAASSENGRQSAPASVWGQPAHRLGVRRPSAAQWWSSGLPG